MAFAFPMYLMFYNYAYVTSDSVPVSDAGRPDGLCSAFFLNYKHEVQTDGTDTVCSLLIGAYRKEKEREKRKEKERETV